VQLILSLKVVLGQTETLHLWSSSNTSLLTFT